jgi:hypothetical protein
VLRVRLVILSLAAVLVCVPAIGQSVPNLISYQGQLNDQTGVPVNGSIGFVFSIYDVPTGGTALWAENQTVMVSSGRFDVRLGTVAPLPPSLFDRDIVYLGLRVGSDQEMLPRQRLTSAAFAMKAQLAPLRTRSVPGLAGDGREGAFVGSSSQAFTRGRVYQFSSFELPAAAVITATGGRNLADPIVIKVNGDCNIAGVTDLSGAGMPAAQDVSDTWRPDSPAVRLRKIFPLMVGEEEQELEAAETPASELVLGSARARPVAAGSFRPVSISLLP